MRDIDEQDIKAQISEISHKIDDIIQKVNDLEPGQRDESGDDERDRTV